MIKPIIPNHTKNFKFYNCDCLDYMKEIPDKYFDLAIVDPPYGIGMDGNTTVEGKAGRAKTFSNKQHHNKKEWDSKRPTINYFIELQRISKNQIIFGGNYFADLLPPKKGWVFWDKKIANANNTNFSDGELAWTSFNCILRRFTYDWIGFGYLNNPQNEKKIHPTQKPIALYDWLYRNYAKKNMKVLDTHLGSGSNAISAYYFGVELFVGVELDPDYFADMLNRFEKETRQISFL